MCHPHFLLEQFVFACLSAWSHAMKEINMYRDKNQTKYQFDPKTAASPASWITEAESAIRAGNSQRAYELSVTATQTEPNNPDAWYLRGSLAGGLEERVLCMNRLNELVPDHRDQHSLTFFALKDFLEREPFLAYRGETSKLYQATTAEGLTLSIPKRRAETISFPDRAPSRLTVAYNWLIFAVVGLLLAGLGTLIFAPLAAWAAVEAKQGNPSHADQVGAAVVLLVATLLFLIALFFVYLFVIHLRG